MGAEGIDGPPKRPRSSSNGFVGGGGIDGLGDIDSVLKSEESEEPPLMTGVTGICSSYIYKR